MIRQCLRIFVISCFFSGAVFAGDCQRISSECVDATAVKNIQGLDVKLEQVGGCWAFEDTYQCRSAVMVNDCQSLLDRGCTQIGTRCVDTNDEGTCVMHERSYQYPDQPETYTEKTVCDQSAFCLEGGAGCFDTSSEPDKDFGQAVAMMEAAREASVYGIDPNKVDIFKGYSETCSIKVLGGSTIKNCCKSAGGGNAFSNYALLGAGMTSAGGVGREAIAMGSKYIYDALYSQLDSGLIKKGLKAMNALGLDEGVFKSQFGLYGFTFEFGLANGFQFAGFDPNSFAVSIAVMLIQEWLRCDQSEQMMAMKRGQNLCVHVDTYCSKKVLKVCIEKKERHCCFNSKLAKIINRQGRAQLGLSMNNCSGFDQTHLQSIDFSHIDLSEFIADVVPKDVSRSAITNKVKDFANQGVKSNPRFKSYYDQ